METEIFKDVKGFEGYYQISNLGRLKSFRNTRGRLRNEPIIVKTWIDGKNKCGYDVVSLHANGKKLKTAIHRLVAHAFIPNPQGFTCINHKDENKRNNCTDNLEWCTHKYNNNYGKLSKESRRGKGGRHIKAFHIETKTTSYFTSELAIFQLFNFTQRIIRKCCNGKRTSAYGYKFQFMEG